MSIITISRGSYSRGKEVAETLARRLGYEVVSREILIEASTQFNVPEVKLIRAIHDAPSILERWRHGKDHYVAYIKAALLKRVKQDNVVYHGLAGHFLLTGIPHVFKARITADLEDRVKEEVRRENVTPEQAQALLVKDDEERRRWALSLYGTDPWDPRLYDLTVHLKTLTVEDAVDLIAAAAAKPGFQTTPESRRIIDDLCLAAQVRVQLQEKYPNYDDIQVDQGKVTVQASGPFALTSKISQDIAFQVHQVDGVKDVRVEVTPRG